MGSMFKDTVASSVKHTAETTRRVCVTGWAPSVDVFDTRRQLSVTIEEQIPSREGSRFSGHEPRMSFDGSRVGSGLECALDEWETYQRLARLALKEWRRKFMSR